MEQVKNRVETKIILHDETPVRSTPRRFAPAEREELNKTIDEWLEPVYLKKERVILPVRL